MSCRLYPMPPTIAPAARVGAGRYRDRCSKHGRLLLGRAWHTGNGAAQSRPLRRWRFPRAGAYNRGMPNRFFNIAGPCNPLDHYLLPSARRLQGVEPPLYFSSNARSGADPGLFQGSSGEATPTSAWSRRSATASPGLPPYRGVLQTAGTANQPGTGLASRAPGDDARAPEKAAKPCRNRFLRTALLPRRASWQPGRVAVWYGRKQESSFRDEPSRPEWQNAAAHSRPEHVYAHAFPGPAGLGRRLLSHSHAG